MRIRVQPSGSRIHRIWKCPPSMILPQVETDEVSPAADRGRTIHSFLERVRELGTEAAIVWATSGMPADEAKTISWILRAINVDDLPTHLATEVAFLYDWKARIAREIGRGLGRDYVGHLRRTGQDPIGPTEIPLTIDLVGVDRIVTGTDFPQGMSVKQPVDFVESIPGLTHREREMILCDNPARLLGI